jgi:hypothetical protein
VDLFQFNDDFIASASWGRTEEDTQEMFVEVVRAGADELERRLIRQFGPEIISQVRFVDGAFEIPLTDDQVDEEYGAGGTPPQARIRRAVIDSTLPASQAMSRMFDAD